MPASMPNRTFENIRFWPVFHSRFEFASIVREALLRDPPEIVAVELPGTWRDPLLQAVNRLPFLSLILGEEGDGQHAFLAVEPIDALMEALRTGRELGLAVELIDLDVERYPMLPEPVPDSSVLSRIGYEAFLDAYYANAAPLPLELDDRRETMMAHALQRLAGNGKRIACVLGANHLPGVLKRMRTPQPRPFGRARARTLKLYNWSRKSSMEFMSESPFLAGAYERWRTAHLELTEGPSTGAPTLPAPPVERESESEKLARDAAQRYREHYLEEISPPEMRVMGTFAKKYALVDGMLVPDLFHLVTSARGVRDDDFAYEVWDLGSHYPWQDGSGLLPSIDLDEQFAYLDGRRLTLHRQVRRRRPRLGALPRKKRLREQYAGRWKSQWSGRMICSHPPEDLVIEEYGRYLKHKADTLLSAELTRVEPFQVSLKDGVDVRETLRNWHEGRLYVRETRRMSGKVGSVVLIFDEDNPQQGSGEDRYPWLVTWLGEHNQESDMAFYATPAGDSLVGPGISRCEYGGFVMSFPPQRMYDVWRDPFFDSAHNKSERLLMAGLDYAEERFVLYVAAKQPRSRFHTLAERMGKKLIYLPLGQLNPGTVRKIRTFHVLDGHHVREFADQYVR